MKVMAKRQAGNYLTDQNWDQEDDSEEPGEFTRANEDTMKSRKICKAKRKTESDEPASGGAFKGFSGFGTSTSKPSSGFGFGASSFSGFSNGKSETASAQSSVQDSKASDVPKVSSSDQTVPSKPSFANGSNANKEGVRTKYLQQLKLLNESVTKWIKEHVDKNPYCLLTPIFKDYEKYVVDLEKKYPNAQSEEDGKLEKVADPKESTAMNVESSSTSGFTFKPEASSPSSTTTSPPAVTSTAAADTSTAAGSTAASSMAAPSMFKFTPSSTTTATTGGFGATSFGSGASTGIFGSKPSDSSSGFSFGTTAPSAGFSFASSKPSGSGATNSEATTEEDEYVPPKPEVDLVKEDDAFYTKRCKLFYKKGDAWQDRGVGNLHLKPCNKKTQLIVRADTSLGNILLNIMLSANMPATRQGKNNVAIVCIPNPPLDEKKPNDQTLTPMLIRVKTSEDADELFEKIKENKS